MISYIRKIYDYLLESLLMLNCFIYLRLNVNALKELYGDTARQYKILNQNHTQLDTFL